MDYVLDDDEDEWPEGMGALHTGPKWREALGDNAGALRDIASECCLAVSSAKSGCGVSRLIDGSTETFWQSDGPQPHAVHIELRQKTRVVALAIYVCYQSDESYTPFRLRVLAGSHPNALREICTREVDQPSAWIIFDMRDGTRPPPPVHNMQLLVLQNHHSGRDTHIRRLKVA